VSEQLLKPLVSLVIVTILGLQAFASVFNPSVLGFPFVAYPMYRAMHYEGDRVLYNTVVYAVDENGDQVRLRPEHVGMSWWLFQRHVVNPMLAIGGWQGDRRTTKPVPQQLIDNRVLSVRKAVDAYCERTGRRLVRLRMEDLGVAVGRQGMVDGLPPIELASVPITCSEK
jgi:hypothetical protein